MHFESVNVLLSCKGLLMFKSISNKGLMIFGGETVRQHHSFSTLRNSKRSEFSHIHHAVHQAHLFVIGSLNLSVRVYESMAPVKVPFYIYSSKTGNYYPDRSLE